MRKAVLTFIVLAFALRAQVLKGGASPSAPLAEAATNRVEQKVGPGDLLSITVADCPELTRNFRVAVDGTLALPLLRERIMAAGKEPEEIQEELAEALSREQILVRPVVSAAVVEYRSVPVSVLGAVRQPITFQAIGYTTLLDALTKAGGLSSEAGPEILVSRPVVASSGDKGLVERVPVKGLIDGADRSLNIRLYGGEEIRVPPAGKIYIIGNVKRTGAFPITDGKDTTVLRAIALTEGLLPYTSKEAFIYRHEAGKGNRDEIPIQLAKIIRRQAPDVALEPDDILYIPDSKGRKATVETIERIASFGTSTASGVLIWH